MCAVSMVIGHYQQRYPTPDSFPGLQQQWPDMQELIRKARLYDEMTAQKDCPDPAKEAWLKQIEDFMREKYGLEPLAP